MVEASARLRWLRYAAWTAAAGIAIGVALAVVVATRFQPEDLARLLTTNVKARTGRDLVIEGPVGYSVSLVPLLYAENVRLQNAPWGSRPDMLTAKRVEVRIALLPLLARRVRIEGLEVIEPDLVLEVDRDGNGNWQFAADEAKPGEQTDDAGGIPLQIAYARMENGTVTYRNAASGRELRIGVGRLDLEGSGRSIEVEGTATLEGVPLEIEATLPAPGAAAGATASEVTLSGPGLRLHARGTLPHARARSSGELAVAAQVSDWAAAGKLLQQQLSQRPPLEASGTVRIESDRIAMEKVEASLGKSRFTGHGQWSETRQGRTLEAQIEAKLVDMTELLGPDTDQPSTGGRIFSADPLPLAFLAALNGKIEARIARIALRDGKAVDNLRFAARLDKGKVLLDPALIDVEGKPLELRLRADAASGKAVKVDLTLGGRGIPLGALGALLDITGTPEGGPTDLDVRLSATGHSVQSLMATASGDIRVVVGPGRIRNRVVDFGADLTELMKLLNPAYAADPYTELECAVVRLPVRQGVARVANTIAVETSKVDIVGAGTIDFRNETLDLGFRTKAVSGLGVGFGTLAELGRLRGPFSAPQVEADLGNAAEAAAHVGLAAITGGLSLIASGLLMQRVPDNPCQVALSGGSAKSAPTRAEKAAPDAPSAVESMLDGIKKLFGR
jgi:uncharacterized protein involved in outer membrane biogenesis